MIEIFTQSYVDKKKSFVKWFTFNKYKQLN